MLLHRTNVKVSNRWRASINDSIVTCLLTLARQQLVFTKKANETVIKWRLAAKLMM
jgi:hypothetical protein